MEDKEIVKALEICTHEHLGCEDGCPFIEECGEDLRALEKAMIGLLKRQKAEIENLNIELQAMRGAANSYKAEVERLKPKCEDCAGCNQWKCDCANIKSYAITTFAEKLKEYFPSIAKAIDHTAEEMKGE